MARRSAACEWHRLLPELWRMTSRRGERELHSYLLLRDRGNVLFHGPTEAAFYLANRERIDRLGGVALHVLTHANEAARGSAAVCELWDAPLILHAADRDRVRTRAPSARIRTFTRSHALASDLRAVHLPGHTPGFTAPRSTSPTCCRPVGRRHEAPDRVRR